MSNAPSSYRVIYVGTGRRSRGQILGRVGMYESERAWRQRLAQEMEEVCQEMARRGLRLVQAVPTLSSASFQGSWTEGSWLYFGSADLHPSAADLA